MRRRGRRRRRRGKTAAYRRPGSRGQGRGNEVAGRGATDAPRRRARAALPPGRPRGGRFGGRRPRGIAALVEPTGDESAASRRDVAITTTAHESRRSRGASAREAGRHRRVTDEPFLWSASKRRRAPMIRPICRTLKSDSSESLDATPTSSLRTVGASVHVLAHRAPLASCDRRAGVWGAA